MNAEDKYKSPQHLLNGVILGVLVFAFSGSLALYFASVLFGTVASAAWHVYTQRRRRNHDINSAPTLGGQG